MKVITIKQPWASLIINGYKEYEFRSWNTKFRGECLIHSSKVPDKKSLEKFKHLNIDFPNGKIIGSVIITDSIKLNPEFNKELLTKNKEVYGLSKYDEGYAFKLENINKFEDLIDIKGKLGFWNYDI